MKMKEIKQRGIFMLKGPILNLTPTHNQFWTTFEQKCRDDKAEWDKIAVLYRILLK